MTKSCRLRGCYESRKWLSSVKDGTKVESMHCTMHACRTLVHFPAAVPCDRVAVPGSKYCDIHPSCSVQECDNQRSPSTLFCYGHTCIVKGCPTPASSNHRCEDHMPCPVSGCPNFLYKRPDGRGWYHACRVHAGKRCDFTGCHKTVRLSDTYCADHICTVRGCNEQRSFGSNCQHHTCAANGCSFQVTHPDLVRPNHRACAFCLAHECQTPGCHAIVTVVQGHCRIHGCRINGCTKARSPDELADGYCISHIKADVYRRGERAGREAEFNDAIERKEKEMDRQRELEKIQREQEDRMRLVEEVESLKLEKQRLQIENASVADHYAAEERSHRHSMGSPRSGSTNLDHPRTSFSYHRRIDDHVYDTLANRGYDDGGSVISGSTDYDPFPQRRAYVRR